MDGSVKPAGLLVQLFCCSLLAGCVMAPGGPAADPLRVSELRQEQQQAAFAAWIADRQRLDRVARGLFVANAAACDRRSVALPNTVLLTVHDFPEPLRSTAGRNGYGNLPRVVALSETTAGGGAGAPLEGDLVVRLVGDPVPDSRRGGPWLAMRLDSVGAPLPGDVAVTVRRGDRLAEVRLALQVGCRFEVELSAADAINAFASGRRITVTRGMMRFVASDGELAFVLAHEMAHNLAHSLPERALAGLSERVAATGVALYRVATLYRLPPPAPRTYAQQLEAEADFLALGFLRAAGYDPAEIAAFWRRLGAIHPRTVTPGYAHSHPTSPERTARLERALETLR